MFLFMKYKTARYKLWNLAFYWNVPEALIFFIYEVQNCPVQALEPHFLLERPWSPFVFIYEVQNCPVQALKPHFYWNAPEALIFLFMKYQTARYKLWNLTFTGTPLKPLFFYLWSTKLPGTSFGTSLLLERPWSPYFFLFMKYKTARYKLWNLTFYWNAPEALFFNLWSIKLPGTSFGTSLFTGTPLKPLFFLFMKYKTARYKLWNLTFTGTPLKPLFFYLFMKYKTARYKLWNLTFTGTPLKPLFFIYLWSTKLPTYEDLSFVDVTTSLYSTPFIQEVGAYQLGP